MPDIFLSYTRDDQAKARHFAESFEAQGFSVWWDVTLRSGEDYDQVTEKALRDAQAVVVLWSKKSVDSRWVRAEATQAQRNKTLVPAMIEDCVRPVMFELTQAADLSHWSGDPADTIWLTFLTDVKRFVEKSGDGAEGSGSRDTAARNNPRLNKAEEPRKLSICVLPFANMSGDVEQEYFSDGISEDIITDLSKVSALSVVARNTSFQFKAKSVDIPQTARQLRVSHVLEGSVRKAGGRVRITAQLIDGVSGNHVWAERYDRDLNDIFALQDEISEAIVKALRLKLLPEEMKAIDRHGTEYAEAYDMYLMARQYLVSGNSGDVRHGEAIIRLCGRAIEIDPGYARAWALMAVGQRRQITLFGGQGDGGMSAADRALALDPNLADAHAVKAAILWANGQQEAAAPEIALALQLEPESYEVNIVAADLSFRKRDLESSIRFYEKASTLVETNFSSSSMLITCYTAVGNGAAARQAAQITLDRVEKALAQDRNNGAAIGHGVGALAVLGKAERAKAWIDRALLLDPDNKLMRYNFACTLLERLKDADSALVLLGPLLGAATRTFLIHAQVDPDLDPLRDDPRFMAMVAQAEARLAAEEKK
ncbi:MAG: TIR domain-containing protein [Rhizomicrobium sp.]|jgi:adenylate cyclase